MIIPVKFGRPWLSNIWLEPTSKTPFDTIYGIMKSGMDSEMILNIQSGLWENRPHYEEGWN